MLRARLEPLPSNVAFPASENSTQCARPTHEVPGRFTSLVGSVPFLTPGMARFELHSLYRVLWM